MHCHDSAVVLYGFEEYNPAKLCYGVFRRAVWVEAVGTLMELCWQVELVFKRLKPLLQLGSIPTKTEEAGEVWINGKILLSLLTEKYLGDIDFPPLGTSAGNRSI